MLGSYSPFWIFFSIFHMLVCLFGIFSQFVFMRTTVWDKKIAFNCRVYLFILSLGYQMILTSFVTTTVICLWIAGSMFEVMECRQARIPTLAIHNFGEFTVGIFHLLINLDRLTMSIRPDRSYGLVSKLYFYASLIVSFVLSVLYAVLVRSENINIGIAFVCITSVNVLSLLIEIKLFHYTNVVYHNTIGRVPLERRLELSTSVTMIRCFLPASICGIFLRFIGIIILFFVFSRTDTIDSPSLLFATNLFFNLDCALFPWFFILFHPSKRQKLKRLLRIRIAPVAHVQKRPQTQQEHFDQFRVLWKLGD